MLLSRKLFKPKFILIFLRLLLLQKDTMPYNRQLFILKNQPIKPLFFIHKASLISLKQLTIKQLSNYSLCDAYKVLSNPFFCLLSLVSFLDLLYLSYASFIFLLNEFFLFKLC